MVKKIVCTLIYVSMYAYCLNAIEKAITVQNASPHTIIMIIHNRWCSPTLDPAAKNTYKFLVQQAVASSPNKSTLTPPQPHAICFTATISPQGSATYRPMPPVSPLLGINNVDIEVWNSTTNTTGLLYHVPWGSILVYPHDMNIQKTE